MRIFGFDVSRRTEKRYSIEDLRREIGFTLFGGELDPARVTQEGYRENPAVGAAVNRILTAAAQVPWIVQVSKENQKGETEYEDVGADHPARRLLEYPSEIYDWSRVVESVIGNLLLYGEAYVYLNGPGAAAQQPGREPMEALWLPRPWLQSDPEASYTDRKPLLIQTRDGTRELPRHRVVEVFFWNPASPFIGQSRIRPAAGSIDASNLGRRWNTALLKNSARPPGVFEAEDSLDETTFQRLKAEIQGQYTGTANAGRPPLLEGGVKWKSTGLNAGELEWLGGMREAKREIATNLMLDPTFLGDPEVRTFANYEEARRGLYEDTVLPLLNAVRSAFEIKLRQWWPELRLFLDTDKVPALYAAKLKQWEGMGGLVDKGILTRNEARREMGFDDADGADVLLVPISLTPIGDVGGGELGGAEVDAGDQDGKDVEAEAKAAAR